jgi:endoglucanase
MKTMFGVHPNLNIIFSPHVYGVSVRGEEHVYDGYEQWESWFGFLNRYYDNVICIGEIGGINGGSDLTWHQNILKYLQNKNIRNFYYWCLNPNSFDTGGLLGADWTTIDESKIDFMYNLQPNPTFIQF